MGYGSYSHEAHAAITAKRSALPTQAVFKQRSVHPLMSPFRCKIRESRHTTEHPNTTSIIFALDVSGSMGAIPEHIARTELPTFMTALLGAKIPDPQVLFLALQDCADTVTKAPLQVGCFESTAELIDQWLTWSWITGGGKSEFESYDLAMFWAAHHTSLDSFKNLGKKGYFFMTGDETCYPALKAQWVRQFLGDEVEADLPLADVVAELKRTYHPFFIAPDPARGARVHSFWSQHFGPGTITLAAPEDTCAVAAGAVALNEGAVLSLSALAENLTASGLSSGRVARVRAALTPYAASLGKV
jgi:hypothetical protein